MAPRPPQGIPFPVSNGQRQYFHVGVWVEPQEQTGLATLGRAASKTPRHDYVPILAS